MSIENYDPTTHRMIQTRSGVVAVPREQKGVPFTEYFRNTDLPADLDRTLVYATPEGPVLARPDPVGWTPAHGEKAAEYAARIKEQVDDKGYYKKTLGMYADRLADETGHPSEEMKAVIVEAFQREHGKDPFTYLQDRRRDQGLPLREAEQPERTWTPDPEG